jgi:acyl carrier protein
MGKMKKKISNLKIQENIINFLKKGNPLLKDVKKIPLDKSLLEMGLIDSFALIELVGFIEKFYKIEIQDDELTKKKFGSIIKMSNLVIKKII